LVYANVLVLKHVNQNAKPYEG